VCDTRTRLVKISLAYVFIKGGVAYDDTDIDFAQEFDNIKHLAIENTMVINFTYLFINFTVSGLFFWTTLSV